MSEVQPRFISMGIQARDVTCDWRSFVTCSDGWYIWEIRGYGSTPNEAVRSAWERFKEPGEWSVCGEIIGMERADT